MWKRKFLICFLVLTIFSVAIVSAQPPFQQSPEDIGLVLETPIIEFIPANNTFEFHTHVFNSSNGILLTNETTDCNIHVYRPNDGEHLVEQPMDFNGNGIDFELEVEGENFSIPGQYSVVMWCNSSGEFGGFIEYPFWVTSSGKDVDEAQAIITLGLVIVLVFLSGILFYLGKEAKFVPFKIFLMALGTLFSLMTIGISVNMARQLMIAGTILAGTFTAIYRISLILVVAGGIGLILYIIVKAVQQFHLNRGLIDSER